MITFLFLELMKKFKLSSVVSLILIGLLLTLPGFKEVFIGDNEYILTILGDIGLFALMFLAGLESSWKVLQKEEKDSFYIALFGAVIPFILGFFIFIYLGFSLIASIIVGICMSITAEATKAKVLFELKKLKTRVGSAMIGAGIIDDVFGLISFTIIMFIVGIKDFTHHIVLFGILLSFIFGILVQKYARQHHLTKKLEFSLNNLLVPFFFISMGLHFDLNSLIISPNLLFLVIIFAIGGKLIGTYLAAHFVNFNFKQLFLIGWAMNSRGAIELALALIAYKSGLIDVQLYSALVLMALITTLFFPFIISFMIKKYPKIMD